MGKEGGGVVGVGGGGGGGFNGNTSDTYNAASSWAGMS